MFGIGTRAQGSKICMVYCLCSYERLGLIQTQMFRCFMQGTCGFGEHFRIFWVPHATNLVALGIPTVSEFVLDIRNYRALVCSVYSFLFQISSPASSIFLRACFGTETPLIHTVIIYILTPISYLLLKSIYKILRHTGRPTHWSA